jgi:hypothetical protein
MMGNETRGLTERERTAIWLGRLGLILAYIAATRWCARDGMTAGEFTVLALVGANAIVVVLSAGWVAGGDWRD